MKFITVDSVGGLGAFAWAVTTHLWSPELGELVDPRAAVLFGLLAFGRWYKDNRKPKPKPATTAPTAAPRGE